MIISIVQAVAEAESDMRWIAVDGGGCAHGVLTV